MRIHSKLILGLLLLLCGITLAIWLTIRLFILPQIEATEVTYRYQDLERVKQAILRDLNRLQSFALDWGVWDDTYHYVQDLNSAYTASNLIGIQLDNIGADLLLISHRDGRILNLVSAGPAAAERVAASKLLDQPRLLANHPFNGVLGQGGSAILDTPAGPLLLAASPILPSGGEGSSRGTLFFGKFVDAVYRQTLVEQIRLPLEFRVEAAGSGASRVTFLSDTESLAHGFMPLLNNPERELCLIIRKDRPFYGLVLRLMNYAVVIILGIGCLVALVAYGFLQLTLIRPIVQLQQQAEALGNGEPLCRPMQRKDELGQLSRSFYQMAGKLEASVGQLETERQQFMDASLTDALTSLKNRRYMEQYLASGMQAADTHGWLLMALDLDHFKRINDVHGHDIGDLVLRQMAALLQELSHQEDTLVRYGGEEFVLICKNVDEQIGCAMAERIRQRVARFHFGLEHAPLALTCSIGFFTLPWGAAGPSLPGWQALFKVADLALYAAKQSGRHCWIGLKSPLQPPASGYPRDGGEIRQALARQQLLSFSSLAADSDIRWPS
ncbi:sensor domain-containing diguanylate cyclase [Zobellella maritima]|uniref:sensor domain-containing diguanylate cyclase n=1 Tax=Zobellella maritima TaxID=2059725 RepID=UPI0018E5019E|nr:diguanylate cyclase [Zobellella maritima]